MAAGRPIAVVGNVNADLSYDVPRLPAPGETLLSPGMRLSPGGKAGNASVTIARLGGRVRLFGCVGEDALGALVLEALDRAGVERDGLAVLEGVGTGVASVLVAPPGEENAIVTFLGANLGFTGDGLDVAGCASLLLTLGLPEPALGRVAETARAADVPLIVDATPLRSETLPPGLRTPWLLSANRGEAATLAGFAVETDADVRRAVEALHDLGAERVVLKLGADGAVWSDGGADGSVASPAVHAVDPTGAGDAFMGALALRLALGDGLSAACAFAAAAGAVATTAPGAQGAVTSMARVLELLAEDPAS